MKALSGLADVSFLSLLRRGNVHGALDAGLAPGLLPGRTTLEAGALSVIDAFKDHTPRTPQDAAANVAALAVLSAGNAVVAKPSEQTSLVSSVELSQKAWPRRRRSLSTASYS